MRLQLLKSNNPLLREISKPVEVFDSKLKLLVLSLYSLMNRTKACGIAAPQVGKMRRIILVAAKSDSYLVPKTTVLINPEITFKSKEMVTSIEGCLSLPGKYFKVTRHKTIEVKFQDTKGDFKELIGDGLWSIAVQHEWDHCQGVLISDHGIPA